MHERELEHGHGNRATLQVARKLVAYLLAVDKSRKPFPWRGAHVQAASTGKEEKTTPAGAALAPA